MVLDLFTELVELVSFLDPKRLHQRRCLTLRHASFGSYALDRVVDRPSTIEHSLLFLAFPKFRSLAHFPHGQSTIPAHNIFVPELPHILDGSVHCKDQELWLGQEDGVRGGGGSGGGVGNRGGGGVN